MIKFLIKKSIKDYTNTEDRKVRERYTVLAGALGIVCNLVLFALKLTIGFVMNSISILSDAFNNLSDMGTSIVEIFSAKLSNKVPDKEHPFGHGRIEYISSLIVACIITAVGIDLFKSSVVKIFDPVDVKFNLVLVIVLSASLLIKIWMFTYNRYMGRAVKSTVLEAAASDSINDVFATAAVIIAIVVNRFIDFPIDGIMGCVVSALILRCGIQIAREVVSTLLGKPPAHELVKELNKRLLGYEGIVGVHDLIVHDYGPGRVFASVHAEVPDSSNIAHIHEIIDEAEHDIYTSMGILLVIHMDPISVDCETTNKIRNDVCTAVQKINASFSIHDFRITNGENRKNLIFDLVVPVETTSVERKKIIEQISCSVKELDPRYCTVIQVDNSYE